MKRNYFNFSLFNGSRKGHNDRYFYLIACLFISTMLAAQFPADYRENQSRTPQQPQKTAVEVDTLSPDVYYFYVDNPSETFKQPIISLNNFHIYDPIRQQEFDFISTGNFGAAHRPIVYQPRFHKGFDVGIHNYDHYKILREDIKYYQLEKAFSDIAFSQGASQEQTNFNGIFTKNITPSINLALDYKLINNKGQYSHQLNKNNAFSLNGWYHSTTDQYKAFFSYTTNTIQQLLNGGVNFADTEGFLSKNILSVGRPINTNAESRYFHREAVFSQYYRLQKSSVDSLRLTPVAKRQYTLFHQLSLQKNTYKYADELSSTQGEYYDSFLRDDRGIRQFLDIRQYENTFSIRTFKEQENRRRILGQAPDQSGSTKDLFEIGLTHTYSSIHQEPKDSSLHNLFLFGKFQYTPSDRLQIKTYAHFGALKQIGDYYIKGDFLLDLPKIGKLELGLIAQHYSPNLLQRELYVTQQPIWQNDFNKTFENSFYASYYFPLLQLQVKGQYHLLTNYIYYDDSAQAQQAAGEVSILQLILENTLKWKGLQLDNQLYFQNTSQAVLRLPTYYSIHRLSFNSSLFKKVMDYQIGAQVRIHAPYFMDGFLPLTTQFFIQNTQRSTFYPTIDAFINVQIEDFRFFINAQNIYDYFSTDFNYPIAAYPQFDSTIRFGFQWKFLDKPKGEGFR